MTNTEISIVFFFQLALILAVVRIVGLVVRKLGQPQVIGEMVAGVLIGPSLFGFFWPDLQAKLFPAPTVPVIYAVSQVGLVLYMFLVGAELNLTLIRERLRSAVMISVSGMIAPFTLGAVLAAVIISDHNLFPPAVSTAEAMLFVGTAMSITAFPTLARIIQERGLAGTMLGTLTLAAGAMDDAAAWCLLAIVLASFEDNATIAASAIGGGLIYAGVVLIVARPLLRNLHSAAVRHRGVSGPMLGFILMLLMCGAWFTDYVGIYAVFGAFILGAAMPRGIVTRDLQKQLDPITTNFLVPLFFVYSGLNTRLDLLVSPAWWGVTVAALLVACIGKGVACWAAARLSGEEHHQAMAIGALMNARGLMELILLNIGLQRGIITPIMFTILVIMAIVTTLMATPLFEIIYRRFPKPRVTA